MAVLVFKDSRKETLFSELSSLLASGLDFSRSFSLLTEGEEKGRIKEMLKSIHCSVVKGNALWQALEENGGFSPLDRGVVRIGEETGRLSEALVFLAEYYRKRIARRRMISSAVSYPLVVLGTAVIVLVFMILVVVPMFEQVYTRMGGELPAMTRGMIALSRSFPYWLGGVTAVAGGGALFFRYFGKRPEVQSAVAAFLLRLPLVGGLIRQNCEARFCSLLWLLNSSGVPLLRSIGLLEGIISFYPYRKSFTSIAQELGRGTLFSTALSLFPRLYDRKLVMLLRVGEETNRLGDMLSRQGEELSQRLEHGLKQAGNLLEPILVLGVGALVAAVLIAMYLPMFRLGTTIY
ncbi:MULTISPECIES: type II secretion system F family protein [Culturomica]|uniref:type II secretion system F family protein n=1 Tax=Culturomica TaxID=1926651 RepID=UPI000E88292C|nr:MULTISPECIES: type II secretion system F family protein [Culturomica]HBO28134.1 type II secretion system F family protein [Culturomica sp.]